MKRHIAKYHPNIVRELEAQEEAVRDMANAVLQRREERDETYTGRIKIVNLRTEHEKEVFYEQVIYLFEMW